ncbi:hypothetical protein D3C87_612480 [compost metagenome]
MAKLTTFIFSEDARSQAEFYIKALGGEIRSMTTYGEIPGTKEELKDKIINLSFVAAGVNFLMSDFVYESLRYGNSTSQVLEFESEQEAREAFDNLAVDGKVKLPLEPAFWGALFGEIEDKYGIRWMITTEPKESQA